MRTTDRMPVMAPVMEALYRYGFIFNLFALVLIVVVNKAE